MRKYDSLIVMLRTGVPVLLCLVFALGGSATASGPDSRQILESRCSECHSTDQATQELSRISGQRKTPEGWHMTLNRMEHRHGVKLPPDEKRTLIKYLADTQGLAPDEAAPYRYLLEQDTNRVESSLGTLDEMCVRCHSAARTGLQRRTAEEWELLMHFHVGQNPTLEIQALSRDREWFRLAVTEVVELLAKQYPLESRAWQNWQDGAAPELAGDWHLVGFSPGKGEFYARMRAKQSGSDRFELQVEGRYADGSPLEGSGTATVYTGYEWRASIDLDGSRMRQVLAASADGAHMQGRQFGRDAPEMGGELRAFRDTDDGRVVAVMPSSLQAGETGTLTIVGNGLSGDVNLGEGVRVVEELSRSAGRITLRARAEGKPGRRDVAVGDTSGPAMLTVYDRVTRLEVQPENAVARIGGPGDAQMEKVRVWYRAVAYAADPDGDDELRIGTVPVSWEVQPADEQAEAAQDHRYAGDIDANGVFTPADAGPNPERYMSANNTGRLAVVATLEQEPEVVEGRASLLVAVPDFIHRVLD